MAGPMDGIHVLDLSRALAGPYCTQLLGDLGADIVKIEPPGGDDSRSWGPPFVDTESVYFIAANRNKRSVVLDLKTEAGIEVLRRLLEQADVLVENYRPGTLDGWGITASVLEELNPQLIHVAISGFGQDGRYRERAGYDLIAQGMGGIMDLTGSPDGPPMKVGLPVADLNAGTWAVIATLVGLRIREQTGKGQYFDVSLLASQLTWHVYTATSYLLADRGTDRTDSSHPMLAPYQPFQTADSWINVAIGSERLWRRFCECVGLDIADDGRFATNSARVLNKEELAGIIGDVIKQHPLDHWMAIFEAAGIPAGPIRSVVDIYRDSWIDDQEQIVRLPHPTIGTYAGNAFPVRAVGSSIRARSAPPLLGEHTAEVATELGFTPEWIGEHLGIHTVEVAE